MWYFYFLFCLSGINTSVKRETELIFHRNKALLEFDLFIYLFIGSNRAKMELLLLLPLLSLVTCAPLGEQANPLEGLEDINSRGKYKKKSFFFNSNNEVVNQPACNPFNFVVTRLTSNQNDETARNTVFVNAPMLHA